MTEYADVREKDERITHSTHFAGIWLGSCSSHYLAPIEKWWTNKWRLFFSLQLCVYVCVQRMCVMYGVSHIPLPPCKLLMSCYTNGILA